MRGFQGIIHYSGVWEVTKGKCIWKEFDTTLDERKRLVEEFSGNQKSHTPFSIYRAHPETSNATISKCLELRSPSTFLMACCFWDLFFPSSVDLGLGQHRHSMRSHTSASVLLIS